MEFRPPDPRTASEIGPVVWCSVLRQGARRRPSLRGAPILEHNGTRFGQGELGRGCQAERGTSPHWRLAAAGAMYSEVCGVAFVLCENRGQREFSKENGLTGTTSGTRLPSVQSTDYDIVFGQLAVSIRQSRP